MQGFHPENIPVAVAALRPGDPIPLVDDRNIFDGGQCRVYKVDFPDGTSWAVRVPLHGRPTEHREATVCTLRAEHELLRDLEARRFRWAPRCHGSSLAFDNAVGLPFIALSWIEGSPLVWTDEHPPRPLRDKVLSQLAEVQVSLLECTRDEKGGSSTGYYYSRIIDSKINRVRSGQLPDLSEEDCLAQRRLLPLMLQQELQGAPFVLDHGDLAPSNILVDPDHNIVGIIDWGFASMVPLQMAACVPRLLRLPDLSAPASPVLQEDRRVFATAVRSHRGCSQVAAWVSLVHSPDNFDLRHAFMESLVSKGMHRSLARLGWKVPKPAETSPKDTVFLR